MAALIAVGSRPLREGLRALLMTIPQVGTTDQVGDAASALSEVIKHQPSLVLLDTRLPGNSTSDVVRAIKANGCPSRCLVLADNAQQRQEARSAGADVVLLKGFPAAKLLEIIEGLLLEQENA